MFIGAGAAPEDKSFLKYNTYKRPSQSHAGLRVMNTHARTHTHAHTHRRITTTNKYTKNLVKEKLDVILMSRTFAKINARNLQNFRRLSGRQRRAGICREEKTVAHREDSDTAGTFMSAGDLAYTCARAKTHRHRHRHRHSLRQRQTESGM